MPAETPGGGQDLAVLDDSLLHRHGAQLLEPVHVSPVRRRVLAIEDARSGQDQRARADRRCPGRPLVNGPQPIEDLIVLQ